MALGATVYGASALVPGIGLSSALGRVLIVAAFPVLLYAVGYFEPENVAAVFGKWRVKSREQRAQSREHERARVGSDL